MVKADGPSDDVLEDLALELGGKWEKLGRRLGFNQTTIENFDSAKRELEDKAFKMLMAWKQKEGSNAKHVRKNKFSEPENLFFFEARFQPKRP